MADYQRILNLENELEAGLIKTALEDKGIPYHIRTYHDLAYDGLFQAQLGWGYLEAPAEYKEEIKIIYKELMGEIDK